MHLDSQIVDIVEVLKKEKAALNARLEEATKKLAAAMEAFESDKQERTKADVDANNRKIQSMNLEPIELMATEHHVHRPSSSGRTDSSTWAEYTANANIEDAKNTSSDEDTIEDCCWGHISRESKDALGDLKSVKSSDSIECLTPSDSSARSNPASSVRSFSSEKEAPLFDQALTSDITTAFKEYVMHELKNGLKKELQTRVEGDFKRSLEQRLVQELSQNLTGEIKGRIYYELREDLMRILKRDITFKLKQDIKHELRLEMGSQLKYDIMEDVKNSVIAEIKETQKEINNELKSEIKGELFNEIKEALKKDAMKELKDTIKAELKDDLLGIAHKKQQAIEGTVAAKAEESMRSAIRAAIPVIQDCVIGHLEKSIGSEVKGLFEDIEGAFKEQEKVLDNMAKTLDDKSEKALKNTMVFQVAAWATMVAKDEVLKLKSTLMADLHKNLKAEIKKEFSQNMEKVAKGMIDE